MSRLPPTKRPPFPASRTHALVYTQAPIFLFIFFFSTKKKQLDSDNLFFFGKEALNSSNEVTVKCRSNYSQFSD